VAYPHATVSQAAKSIGARRKFEMSARISHDSMRLPELTIHG
jgi:hypothetical protein